MCRVSVCAHYVPTNMGTLVRGTQIMHTHPQSPEFSQTGSSYLRFQVLGWIGAEGTALVSLNRISSMETLKINIACACHIVTTVVHMSYSELQLLILLQNHYTSSAIPLPMKYSTAMCELIRYMLTREEEDDTFPLQHLNLGDPLDVLLRELVQLLFADVQHVEALAVPYQQPVIVGYVSGQSVLQNVQLLCVEHLMDAKHWGLMGAPEDYCQHHGNHNSHAIITLTALRGCQSHYLT